MGPDTTKLLISMGRSEKNDNVLALAYALQQSNK